MIVGILGSSLYLCGMFVQRKRNESGSYSVIIKEKNPRTRGNRVVMIVGTSRNERELLELERKAYEYIDSLRGPLLPMDYHDPLEDGIEKFLSSISNSHIQVIGVMPTRFSLFLISLGIPTFIIVWFFVIHISWCEYTKKSHTLFF